jgi:hypothetical protein
MNHTRKLSGLLFAATVSAGAQADNIKADSSVRVAGEWGNPAQAAFTPAQSTDAFPWTFGAQPLWPFADDQLDDLKKARSAQPVPAIPQANSQQMGTTHQTMVNQPAGRLDVAEPGADLLMLAALGAAAIAIRRQSPY